ncbi:MAG TPA: tRNA pseudouridine(55) synthase TruB [Candidatus Saccharimonadales bacterium]|nr:tRNA pseudouridine(55) synthase TruB [Candidatus Saccharimonadales bacterium]
MDGYSLVDKPVGISSFGVVAKVKRLIREQTGQKVKIGHTGTLDPLASGLMIMVLGSYTKRASEFSKLDKTYEVELTLGYVSKTGDAEGPIAKISDKQPTEMEIKHVLDQFIGQIKQTPHAHSAVKVGGQRAYKLARAGKEFKIEPRQVTIYSIDSVEYEYPKLRFSTEVSSGTYIRSLAEEIGEELDTGAYMSALRRTKVGNFDINDAKKLDKVEGDNLKSYLQK